MHATQVSASHSTMPTDLLQWRQTKKEVRCFYSRYYLVKTNSIAFIPGRRTRSGRSAPVVSPPTTRRTRKTTASVIETFVLTICTHNLKQLKSDDKIATWPDVALFRLVLSEAHGVHCLEDNARASWLNCKAHIEEYFTRNCFADRPEHFHFRKIQRLFQS